MISEVRSAILSILNKNNFGYLNPQDFNSYGELSQLEIYKEYFPRYNKQINLENARLSGSDIANISQNIAENIDIFSTTNFLTPSTGNIFNLPSLTTTGDEAYLINKILCYPTELKTGTNTSVTVGRLVDNTALFTTYGISANDIVVNTSTGNIARVVSVISNTILSITPTIFPIFPVGYMIIKASDYKEAEKVSHGKISLLTNSNLTAPNNIFPAYTIQNNLATIYPSTINDKGKVLCQYYRLPKAPKWTYITVVAGEPVFDASQPDYQDFELSPQEFDNLVLKILQYAGVSLKDASVYQAAQNEETENRQL